MDAVAVTYRHGPRGWDAFLSSGQRLSVSADGDEAGLRRARAAVRRHVGGRPIAVERVDVTLSAVPWQGLWFEPLPVTYGLEDPSPAQTGRLMTCWDFYRTSLPPDTKVELYGNRVRIEPGAFGARAALLDAIGGALAGAAPDDLTMSMAPHSRSASHAREQLRRARALPVPDGFVRIVQDMTGFEDEGTVGVIYVLLKERWDLDRPY